MGHGPLCDRLSRPADGSSGAAVLSGAQQWVSAAIGRAGPTLRFGDLLSADEALS